MIAITANSSLLPRADGERKNVSATRLPRTQAWRQSEKNEHLSYFSDNTVIFC